MNKIKKFLNKFDVDFTQYGEKEEDSIDIEINDVIVTFSAFDEELEVCCFVETDKETKRIINDGFTTYNDVMQTILEMIVNKRG